MRSNTIRWADCGRRGNGFDVCSAVYRYYLCTNVRCLLPALKGEGRFANWVMTSSELNMMFIQRASDWLRLRLMDQSQEILLGHSLFAISEYGYHCYRRIARSISNRNTFCGTWYLPHSHVHNKRTVPIIMTEYMAQEREGYISTSGLKSDVIIVFFDPDFLYDA